MAVSRDLASTSLWVESLERSLARRGRPRRASLELGMLTPPRDLSDPDNLAESVLYWRTRRATANSSAIPAAGSATALALLAATTIPSLAGGRADSAKTLVRGSGRLGVGSATRSHLVARVPHHAPFDASTLSGLGRTRALQQSYGAVTYGGVAAVQKMLGVSADGKLGPVTAAAIRHFQATHNLPVNGVVDQTTFNAMQAAYTAPAQPTAPTVAGSAAPAQGIAHAAMASVTTVAATAPVVAQTPTTDASSTTDGTDSGGTTASATIATATTTDTTTADATAPTTTTPATATDASGLSSATTTDTTDTTDTTVGTQPAVPEGVSALQAALHVPVDGTFGSQTKAAVETFQADHGLTADGVVGPATREALGLGDGPTLQDTQPPPPAPVPTTTSTTDQPTTGTTDASSTDTSSSSSSDTTSSTDTSSTDTTSTGTTSTGTPANVATGINDMIQAAQTIATTPYIWGGGHGSWVSPGYDCSGSVSYVLHAAGLLSVPEDSSELMSYGAPGPGQYVTIYAAPGHAWMTIDGRRFDTVALQETGSRWADGGGEFAGFVERHPVGY